MANEKNVKNEKNEKIEKLLRKNLNISTLYKHEKNLNNGKEYITVNDRGYEKLAEFFFNNDNIKTYNINSYYIECLNDIRKEYNEKFLINGIEKNRQHVYYSRIASDTLEYELFKTVLDEM